MGRKDYKYNNVTVKRNNLTKKQLRLEGSLGYKTISLEGKDVSILSKEKNISLFFRSKISFRTFTAIFKNVVKGVNKGYYVELDFVGLGYRFIYNKSNLLLKLGYAHYIQVKRPKHMHIFGYKKKLILFSIDLQQLNVFINSLVSFQKVDSYKGKGIQISGRPLKLKLGKQKL